MLREEKQHGTIGFPFEIYHNICKNGLSLYTHYHREFEIVYITSGTGIVYVDNECLNVSPGDILFIGSEQLHGIVKGSNDPGSYWAFVFAPEFIGISDVIADKYITPVLNKSIHIPTRVNNSNLASYLFQLSALPQDEYYELKIKYYMIKIWEILISTSEPYKLSPKIVKLKEIRSAIDYIKLNYPQKITLNQLAKSANMSKEYFCRQFKETTGVSPIHYLMQIRIEKSCLMLKNTEDEIGQIAMKCGFSSFSYFSEIFKKIIACTPKEYRKKYLSNDE